MNTMSDSPTVDLRYVARPLVADLLRHGDQRAIALKAGITRQFLNQIVARRRSTDERIARAVAEHIETPFFLAFEVSTITISLPGGRPAYHGPTTEDAR